MLRAIAVSLLLLSTASGMPAFAQGSESHTIVDDLMPAIWERLQQGKSREVVAHSRHLLREDMDNALALAALIDAHALASDEDPLELGERGLRSVGSLRHPRGMSEEDFLAMMKRVRLILNSAVGKAYMERNDPLSARRYLKEAVALAPGDAQNAYLAARAYLEGPKPDAQIGYWLLARSVVLTQGMEAGDRIAKYAWEQFWGAGGSEQGWRDYLAVAAAGAPRVRSEQSMEVAEAKPLAPDLAKAQSANITSPKAPGGPSASSSRNTTIAANSSRSNEVANTPSPTSAANPSTSPSVPPASQPTAGNMGSSAPTQQPAERTADRSQIATATQPTPPGPPTIASGRRQGGDQRTLPQSESGKPPELPTLAENAPPRFPSPAITRPRLSPEAPISLGVLIEASVASPENRANVVYALSDLLRNLRANDEAFIVAYGRNVGIEQDLTWNYDLLEKAMENIDRRPGAALLDAVAFSAGHLARVAQNPNRVLLVISDGTNEVGKQDPIEHAAEIRASGARIYCIGVAVPGSGERDRLQEIASLGGGQATFVDDPRGFRSAARTIATTLGIDFPD